jgi:DNA-binding HxlR family transcriptional regulator
MFNIHVFISGESNYDTFKKTLRYYQFSRIVILKTNINVPERAKEAHESIEKDCHNLDIDFEEIIYEDNNIEDEIIEITGLKTKYPEATFYFNVTGGRKPEALMAAMTSVWIGGISYYWPEFSKEPFELPIPRISVNDLAKNKLHLKILENLVHSPQNQSKIRAKIKTLPGTGKDLTPQALSNSIKALENYGLVTKKVDGRESIVTITLSGKIAYSMIMK